MIRTEVARGAGGPIVIMDSITQLEATDSGAIVVSGSHGGVSSAEFALAVPLRAVFFNDAGVGKEGAGVAALAILQARRVAAGTVAQTSARIGDARDAWQCGMISLVNAAALGLAPGQALCEALGRLAGSEG